MDAILLVASFFAFARYRRSALGLLCLGAVVVFQAVSCRESKTSSPAQDMLPLSPDLIPEIAAMTSRPAPRDSVEFEGREYNLEEGRQVLMGIVRNRVEDVRRRGQALETLAHLGRQLAGTEEMDQLVELYRSEPESTIRAGVLMALHTGEDPRCLDMSNQALAKETDEIIRLFAAANLANWNVRAGVAELLRLLDSHTIPPGSRGVAEEASIAISSLNRSKGWGFPSREIQEEIQRVENATKEEKRIMWRDRWRTWFDANQNRFPVWPPEVEGNAPASAPGEGQQPGAK